jgi:Domain of unknown function (DUF4399)
MKRTCALCLALLLPLAAAAGDSTMSDAAKKAAQSQGGQNAKAKALAAIGMDYTPSPAGAKAYFIAPANGAEVKSPVKVVFGLSGMGIAPAGTQFENTGHHHLLVDGPTVDTAKPLPTTDQVKHFGKGQTEASIDLKPGKHTLQLVLGDYKHQPHNPPVMSETITITVK